MEMKNEHRESYSNYAEEDEDKSVTASQEESSLEEEGEVSSVTQCPRGGKLSPG